MGLKEQSPAGRNGRHYEYRHGRAGTAVIMSIATVQRRPSVYNKPTKARSNDFSRLSF